MSKMPNNWRLVCHRCSHRYPKNAACAGVCCNLPELHIHNIDEPCDLCEGDDYEFTTEEKAALLKYGGGSE